MAQHMRAEGLDQLRIRRVAATRHQDAADARRIVARIESPPLAAEINFHPGAEILIGIRRRQADVADIAGAIARRNVHAAREGDGCLLYTSPSPRDGLLSRMPSSA